MQSKLVRKMHMARPSALRMKRPRLLLSIRAEAWSSGEKFIYTRNQLKGAGLSDTEADVVVSQFPPSFLLADLTERVLERLDKIEKNMDIKLEGLEKKMDIRLEGLEKKIDIRLEGLEKNIDVKLQNQFLTIVAAGSVIAWASVTSGNWWPVLTGLIKLPK